MIFHDREDLLQGEGGDYEAVPCRLEQQDTEGWTVGVEGGQTSLYEPCIFCSSVLLCEKKNIFETRRGVFSLTKDIFFLSQSPQSSRSFLAHCFEPTERLRHTEFTEAFQLTLAVRFCEIGWLNVSVKPYVFCSSVFSVRKNMSFFFCHYVILS